MVGLYYKRREERSQHKYLNLIGKCLLGIGALVLIGVIFVVFFFNGERIKGPVSVYLSAKLESPVTIGSADFSPLYPDVMRLSDVRFGGTRINELYVEYDVGSLFSNKALILKDLYINGLSLGEADIEKFKLNRFKHESINIDILRLNHIPLNFAEFKSKDLNLRLRDVVYDEQGLSFSSGILNALSATFHEEKVSNLSVEFKTSNQGYLLSNLSVNILGGTVSGTGMFYPSFAESAKGTGINSTRTADSAHNVLSTSSLSVLGLDLSDMSFSLISSANAEEVAPQDSSLSTATTPATATATTASAATATSSAASKATQDITTEFKQSATNNFTATPSKIENTFNAVDDKAKKQVKSINQSFMGLISNSQDPCAYQQVLSSMQPSAGHLDFDELYLTKLVLPRCLILPGNFAITAKRATLSDVIITNQNRTGIKTGFLDAKKAKELDDPADKIAPIDENTKIIDQTAQNKGNEDSYTDYVVQGINGHITDLKVSQQDQMLGSFVGTINEISLPNLQTVFEQNRSSIHFTENGLSFELKGNVYEGHYQVRGEYDRNQTLLTLSDLRLAKNKLALNQQRWKFLQQGLSTYQVKLRSLSFDKLEFLSYINDFPVSIQSISGNAANWKFNNPERKRYVPSSSDNLLTTLKGTGSLKAKDKSAAELEQGALPSTLSFNIEGDPNAMLNIDLTNTLYSDLLMRKAQIVVSLSDDILNISLPKLHFNESELTAQASIGLVDQNANSYFTAHAENFEIADLNSNMINHLLTGKVNVNLNLSSQHNNLSEIWENLEGQVNLTSDALLISDLGIDLINGGPKKNYKLSGTELMTAVQGSVAGINDLNVDINFSAHEAKVTGDMGLATSLTSFEGTLDLIEHRTQGKAHLISLAQDSATQVTLEGTLTEPVYEIVALKRGEQRPGLYLPQYEASAIAKEQTDASRKHFTDDTTQDSQAAPTQPTEATGATEDTEASSRTKESNQTPESTEQSSQNQIEQAPSDSAPAESQSSQYSAQTPVTTLEQEQSASQEQSHPANEGATDATPANDTQTEEYSQHSSDNVSAPEVNTATNTTAKTEIETPAEAAPQPAENAEATAASTDSSEQDLSSLATEQDAASHNNATASSSEQAESMDTTPEPALANKDADSTESTADEATKQKDSTTNSLEHSQDQQSVEQNLARTESAPIPAEPLPEGKEESLASSETEQKTADKAEPILSENEASKTSEAATTESNSSEALAQQTLDTENTTQSSTNSTSNASADAKAAATNSEYSNQATLTAEDTKDATLAQENTSVTASSDNQEAGSKEASSLALEKDKTMASTNEMHEAGATTQTAENQSVSRPEEAQQTARASAQSTDSAASMSNVASLETDNKPAETETESVARALSASQEQESAEAIDSSEEQQASKATTESDIDVAQTEAVSQGTETIQAQEQSEEITAGTESESAVAENIESKTQSQEQAKQTASTDRTATEPISPAETEAQPTQSVAATNALDSKLEQEASATDKLVTQEVDTAISKAEGAGQETSQTVATAEQAKESTAEQPKDSQPADTTQESLHAEQSQATNETLDTQDKATSSPQVAQEQATQSTQIELQPSDSVQLSKPESKPMQEQGSNVSITQGQSQEQKRSEMEKRADAIENNLLEQAAFDSFFSFDGFFEDEGEDESGKEQSTSEGKGQGSEEDFSFNNQDDEMIF